MSEKKYYENNAMHNSTETKKTCPWCGAEMGLLQEHWPTRKIFYYLCRNDDCKSQSPRGGTFEEVLKKCNPVWQVLG